MPLSQRQPRIEDPAYLAYVRTLPCLVCRRPGPNDPAHLRSAALQYGKRPTGLAEKPDDKWVLPLCRNDHTEQHRHNELAWWASKGVADPFAVAVALYAARPAELRPLPAPARPRTRRASKPKLRKALARTKIAAARKIPARKASWPKRELQSRNDLRKER